MKRTIHLLCTLLLLGIVLLASCSSHNNSPTKPKNDNRDTVTSDDKSVDNKGEDKQGNEENTNSEDQDSLTQDEGNQENTPNIADQLKMKDTYIKQPAHFPVDEDVTPKISKNTSSVYSIDYQTGVDKNVANFTGTLYKSVTVANDNLNDFMNGKAVSKNNDTGKDLGHGIKGYSEGAAGHAYFSWEEGNWTMIISSISEDQMDNPAIAKKMVDYLETHSLPAPKDTGIVSIDYPQGGNSVNVDIRWQEDSMVYQLKTSRVPLDALKMTTSVE